MNRCLQKTDISEWMTKEKHTLIQKGTASNNEKPITCLPVTWKINEIYDSLINHGLFPQEQKRCCKSTKYKGKLLYCHVMAHGDEEVGMILSPR